MLYLKFTSFQCMFGCQEDIIKPDIFGIDFCLKEVVTFIRLQGFS